MDRQRAIDIINITNSSNISEYAFQAIVDFIQWRNTEILKNKYSNEELTILVNYLINSPLTLANAIVRLRKELALHFNVYLLHDKDLHLICAY